MIKYSNPVTLSHPYPGNSNKDSYFMECNGMSICSWFYFAIFSIPDVKIFSALFSHNSFKRVCALPVLRGTPLHQAGTCASQKAHPRSWTGGHVPQGVTPSTNVYKVIGIGIRKMDGETHVQSQTKRSNTKTHPISS